MTPNDVSLTVGILSPIASGMVALTVLWASPRLTFRVWKRQKLRDQQLQIAERFDRLSIALDNGPQHFMEERAIVMLAAALFESQSLKRKLKEVGPAVTKNDLSAETFDSLSRLRTEITMLMYVEALELQRPN